MRRAPPGDVGIDVTLMGWVHKVRDLGSLIFLDIRDRHGITQVVGRATMRPCWTWRSGCARSLSCAWKARSSGAPMRRSIPSLPRGEVEVAARAITVLNQALTPPFQIDEETPVSEEVRLRYRYLDLRDNGCGTISACATASRWRRGSVSTATDSGKSRRRCWPSRHREGARDYLVPSRVHAGQFYALPQSPQIFKQILMIAGMDRYFQIVRCFRDEDLRADRQPEFTQIDIEMSFATPDLIFGVVEELMHAICRAAGRDVPRPFLRMPFDEAIARYGTDKPDLRCELEIRDVLGCVRRVVL